MQLLPVAASPLYLCLDRDGSVCIDFGPDGCSCCHDEHDSSDAAEPAAGKVAATEHAPCDCAHIRISPSVGLVILPASVDSRPDAARATFQSPAGDGTSAALTVTLPVELRRVIGQPPGCCASVQGFRRSCCAVKPRLLAPFRPTADWPAGGAAREAVASRDDVSGAGISVAVSAGPFWGRLARPWKGFHVDRF